MIKNQFLKTIRDNNLIEENDHIIVGFSGGPDSYALLLLLLEISKDMNLTIYTAHLNHKFRGAEADLDEVEVKKIAEKLATLHFSKEVDCAVLAKEWGLSSEDVGRRERYKFFKQIEDEILSKNKDVKVKVAVGQNANDQAETIFFRIIRGSSGDGIGGIKYISQSEYGSKVIRPILDIKRKDIEKYCEERQVKPLIDKTNSKDIYTRNKLRLKLIPHIEREFNENFQNALISLGQLARDDSDFIYSEVDKVYEKALLLKRENFVRLDLKEINACHKAVWSRVLIKALKEIGSSKNIRASHIEKIGQLLETKEGTKLVKLPFEADISIGYGYIDIIRCLKEKKIDIKISFEDISQFNDKKVNIKEVLEEDNKIKIDELFIDLDKFVKENQLTKTHLQNIAEKIVVRKRQEGDFFRMNKALGRKKLKKLLIDNKIPKIERDKLSMVAFGKEILWIEGISKPHIKSQKYALDENSKRLIHIEITE